MNRVIIIIALMLSIYCNTAVAGKDEEVSYLLDYIEQSGCTFIRNGKSYPAAEASAHMARKYAHVESKIKTSEQFIEYIATRSSISGKPYEIDCDGESSASAAWLKIELNRFRETH